MKKRIVKRTRREMIAKMKLMDLAKQFREKQRKFICNLKFANDLPDLPADAKYLRNPVDLAAYYGYTEKKKMEARFLRRLHAERRLGVDLSLVDVEPFARPGTVETLHRRDKALIVSDDETEAAFTNSIVTTKEWLRKATVLETDKFTRSKDVGIRAAEEEESKRAAGLEVHDTRTPVETVRESFAAVERPAIHPKSKKLRAVKEWSVVPRLDLLAASDEYFLISFDQNPSEMRRRKDIARDKREETRRRKKLRTACKKSVLRIEGGDAMYLSFMVPSKTDGEKEKEAVGEENVTKYASHRNAKLQIEERGRTEHVCFDWDPKSSASSCDWFVATTTASAQFCPPDPDFADDQQWHSIKYLPESESDRKIRSDAIEKLKLGDTEEEREKLDILQAEAEARAAMEEAGEQNRDKESGESGHKTNDDDDDDELRSSGSDDDEYDHGAFA